MRADLTDGKQSGIQRLETGRSKPNLFFADDLPHLTNANACGVNSCVIGSEQHCIPRLHARTWNNFPAS